MLKNRLISSACPINCVLGERSLGIGPLDPLKVSALHIGQGSGPVAVELDFNDLDFKGVSDVKIMNAK